MINIGELIEKNRKEAFNLVIEAGGKINFNDDWSENPCVVLDLGNGIFDAVVASVCCKGSVENGDDGMEFLCYSLESGLENIGWVSASMCCYGTENEVFMYLGEKE